MAPLAFTTTLTSAGDALIALTGELDLSGAASLDEELDRLAGDDRVRRVYLDLRELEFMDSSGLRLVALAERRLGAVDRPLVLVRGPETVQRVFAITRMEDHLTFVDEPPARLRRRGGGMMIDVELPSTPSAPARARGALDQLGDRISAERMRDVRLLVSELVTNAVRHAGGEAVRLVVAMKGSSPADRGPRPRQRLRAQGAAGRSAARVGLGPRAGRGAGGPLGRRPQPAHAGVVRDGLRPSVAGFARAFPTSTSSRSWRSRSRPSPTSSSCPPRGP